MTDLDPLLAWLRTGRPVKARTDFPAGTALPDGRLDLCKQDLGSNGAREVVAALRPGGPVHHLLLGTNALGDAGASDAAAGALDAGVRTVYLGCNDIGTAGACRIADRLVASPGVVRGLWLKRNPLGREGGRLGGELVVGGLTTLDLVRTGLDAKGVAALADAACGTVTGRLFLSGNPLGPDGAVEVARLIGAGVAEELYVAAAGLGDAGARTVAAALRSAPVGRLTRLSLAGNGIGPRALVEVVTAAAGAGVRVLDLGRVRAAAVLGAPDNRIDEPGTAAVGAALGTADHRLAHLILSHTGVTSRGALALLAHARRARTPTRYVLGAGVSSRVKRELTALTAGVPPLTSHPEIAAIASVHR